MQLRAAASAKHPTGPRQTRQDRRSGYHFPSKRTTLFPREREPFAPETPGHRQAAVMCVASPCVSLPRQVLLTQERCTHQSKVRGLSHHLCSRDSIKMLLNLGFYGSRRLHPAQVAVLLASAVRLDALIDVSPPYCYHCPLVFENGSWQGFGDTSVDVCKSEISGAK